MVAKVKSSVGKLEWGPNRIGGACFRQDLVREELWAGTDRGVLVGLEREVLSQYCQYFLNKISSHHLLRGEESDSMLRREERTLSNVTQRLRKIIHKCAVRIEALMRIKAHSCP